MAEPVAGVSARRGQTRGEARHEGLQPLPQRPGLGLGGGVVAEVEVGYFYGDWGVVPSVKQHEGEDDDEADDGAEKRDAESNWRCCNTEDDTRLLSCYLV